MAVRKADVGLADFSFSSDLNQDYASLLVPMNNTSAATGPRTLYDKIWHDHVVDYKEDGLALIYIDRHLVHEVTSPQAFEGLRNANRPVRRPDCTLATVDHNVPYVCQAMMIGVL